MAIIYCQYYSNKYAPYYNIDIKRSSKTGRGHEPTETQKFKQCPNIVFKGISETMVNFYIREQWSRLSHHVQGGK